MSRSFPYAYRDLQDSLTQLITNFTRVGITSELPKLDQKITKQTPEQLTQLLERLKVEHTALHPRIGEALGLKITDDLLENFIKDAEIFAKQLSADFELHPIGEAQDIN